MYSVGYISSRSKGSIIEPLEADTMGAWKLTLIWDDMWLGLTWENLTCDLIFTWEKITWLEITGFEMIVLLKLF